MIWLNVSKLDCTVFLIYISLIKSGGLLLHIETRVTSGFIVAIVVAEFIVEVVNSELRIRPHVSRNNDERLAFLIQFARGSFVNLFH